MKFTKMHGCGNDYIYFDCTKSDFPGGAEGECKAAIKLSDRHLGIGGDGIIIIKKGIKADFEMVMYNADGSRSQMCGNGIRCVGKLVYDAGYTKGHEFTVESMGAVKLLTVIEGERGDRQTRLSVDMGKPILAASKIPVAVVEKSTAHFLFYPDKILTQYFLIIYIFILLHRQAPNVPTPTCVAMLKGIASI